MFFKILLWHLASISYFIGANSFESNMTEYYKMPQLYNFDDYDRCLQQFENLSTYCFVRADVLPQPDSPVWHTIAEVTKYRNHHFDHQHLYFGICVSWCEQQIAQLDDNVTNALFGGILANNQKVNTYLNLFSVERGNRQRFNRLVNQCINLRLQQRHGLRAESVVEYCDTNRRVVEQDSWNLAFYVIVLALISLCAFSSFFDLYLKLQRRDKLLTDRDHYKTPVSGIGKNVGVAFSITRNWYRLNQEPTGKIGRDLRFLDCFKFFCMFLVIFAHSNGVLNESAIATPQDSERMIHSLVGTLFIAGPLITETFFVIAGLLMTLNWIAVTKVKKDLKSLEYVKLFLQFNISRYIRLTVPYAFAILMSGVYFDNAGGPLWRHIYEREQLACRKNWWANLLYINSFVNTDERCIMQGWYLAADTHSFILSLIILMVATRWPQIRKCLFGLVIAVSCLIPGIYVYLKRSDSIFIPSLQTQKDFFVGDRSFKEFYTPFYMNFGSYFFGVLAALGYDEIATNQYKLRKQKIFQVIWYALIPLLLLTLFSANPMVQYYEKKPSLISRVIFAAIHRNIWGFGVAMLIIGMSAKVGWVLHEFTCLPIFRILGRLTYGAFFVHILVCRAVVGTLRTPIFFGTGVMFTFISFTMTASYLISLILTILLELPVSSLLKLLR